MNNPKFVYEHIIRLRKIFLANSTGNLLDHGSGNGILSYYFKNEGFCVYAVDVLEEPRKMHGIVYKKIDPTKNTLPFPNNFFDVVISNQVLNFILCKNQILKTINEIARILRPNGKLVLTFMSPQNYFFENTKKQNSKIGHKVLVKINNRIKVNKYYFKITNLKKLIDTLKFNNLKIVKRGYFDYSFCDIKKAHHTILLAQKNENKK